MPVNCRRVRAAIAIAAAGNLNRGKEGAAPHSIVLGNGAMVQTVCVWFGLRKYYTAHMLKDEGEEEKESELAWVLSCALLLSARKL